MNIYFAGKFKYSSLDDFDNAFLNDYRANIFGLNHDQSLLTGNRETDLGNNLNYNGSFYLLNDTSNSQTTLNIVNNDMKLINESDVFVCVFDKEISLGSCSELTYAANIGKHIIILYEKIATHYDLKSEYWFSISMAELLCKKNNKFFKAVELSDYDFSEIDNKIKECLDEIQRI